jgi:hypothetical protein
MCGHDYGNPNFPGVKRAVDEFAQEHGLAVGCDQDMVWYFERCPVHSVMRNVAGEKVFQPNSARLDDLALPSRFQTATEAPLLSRGEP